MSLANLNTADFIKGPGVTQTGRVIDVSGEGATNLAYDPATRVVSSDTGMDATLTLADGTNPGLMSSANFTKLAGINFSGLATITVSSVAPVAPVAGDLWIDIT